MSKALTFVLGISFATLLVGAGFLLGALTEMHYHEGDVHDSTCPECIAQGTRPADPVNLDADNPLPATKNVVP